MVGRCYDQDVLGFGPRHLLRGFLERKKGLDICCKAVSQQMFGG